MVLEAISYFPYLCTGNQTKQKGTKSFPSSFIPNEYRHTDQDDRTESAGYTGR